MFAQLVMPLHPGESITSHPNLEFDYFQITYSENSGNDIQIFLKTSVPLVPPNPNEFDRAASIFISLALLGT